METITSILETKKSNDNLYETKNEKIIEVGEKIGMKSNFIQNTCEKYLLDNNNDYKQWE